MLPGHALKMEVGGDGVEPRQDRRPISARRRADGGRSGKGTRSRSPKTGFQRKNKSTADRRFRHGDFHSPDGGLGSIHRGPETMSDNDDIYTLRRKRKRAAAQAKCTAKR
ncbi:hypothetical protein MKK75_01230, partial [Methylobacterium sp. J-030]|nr:hypothetical protein [Methylobacterium sp. J-030]